MPIDVETPASENAWFAVTPAAGPVLGCAASRAGRNVFSWNPDSSLRSGWHGAWDDTGRGMTRARMTRGAE